MNLLCDILFGLRVMLLNMLSYLRKLLHFVQKFIKLLRQSSFGLRGLCTCLSKILNQMKIRNRFVHFSIFFYFKELVWQNFGYLSTPLLYLNHLKNWLRKITEYSHVFFPNIHTLRSPLVLCSNSLNHSSIFLNRVFLEFYLYLEFI